MNQIIVYFAEKNIYGAWAVYGVNGVKQYYGYTKSEAIDKYKEQAKKEIFVNLKSGKNDMGESIK